MLAWALKKTVNCFGQDNAGISSSADNHCVGLFCLLRSWSWVLGLRLEGPFGKGVSSALWPAKNTCCACFAICSFHCCISEVMQVCLCGAFHSTAGQMYQLTHSVTSSSVRGQIIHQQTDFPQIYSQALNYSLHYPLASSSFAYQILQISFL